MPKFCGGMKDIARGGRRKTARSSERAAAARRRKTCEEQRVDLVVWLAHEALRHNSGVGSAVRPCTRASESLT